MGQMTVEQWYGTIKTGLTKKLTENKEALPAGFNQQRFILNCITVIQDMMKDDKKKAQLEKINPETIPVCLAKQRTWDWTSSTASVTPSRMAETSAFRPIIRARSNCASGTAKIRLKTFLRK